LTRLLQILLLIFQLRRAKEDNMATTTPSTAPIADPAWDAAPTTTTNDLNSIAGVDSWLHDAVEPADARFAHYSDQWSYFMFWINDIRYADRVGTGNQITTGESQNTKNARETRTVVEGGPHLVNRGKPFTTPGATQVVRRTGHGDVAFVLKS
jgi:hypothetical protein